MTITPVPVRPAMTTPGARDDRPAGDPGGFAALVSRETDRLAGRSGDGSGAVGGGPEPDGGTADTVVVEVSADAVPGAVPGQDPGPVAGVLAAPGGVGPDPQAGAGASTSTRAVDPADPASPGTGPGTVVVATTVPGEAGTVPAAPPTGTGVPGAGGLAAGGPTPTRSTLASTTPGSTTPASTTPGGTASGGTVPEAGSPDAGTGGPEADAAQAMAPAEPAGSELGGSVPSTSAADVGADPVAAPGSLTPNAGAEAAEPAPAPRSTAALLDQVSPTLTRLVSRGDGEHRMTLKIHPADLGEVHLTVTVRGERVDVDIASSAEARELLRDGLTALRTLLDPTGRGGGQLVFRDLPQAPAGQPVAAETGTGGDLGDRSGVGDGSAPGHDRRGQPGGPAARTPGAADLAPAPTSAPTRPAGTRTVDLTI